MPSKLPYSLGFSRYALNFNGSNYVRVPHSTSLDGDVLSFDFWVAPNRSAMDDIYATPITKARASVSTYGGYYIIFDDRASVPAVNRLNVTLSRASSNAYWYKDNFFFTDKWTHVAIVVDIGAIPVIRVYRNSEEITPSTFSNGSGAHTPSTIDLGIGAFDDGTGGFYTGLMNEIKIYKNHVLTPTEIRWNMLNYHNPIRSGLVLWLPFEEGTGLTAYDKSGYGNHGALNPADDPPIWTRVKQYELRAEAGL